MRTCVHTFECLCVYDIYNAVRCRRCSYDVIRWRRVYLLYVHMQRRETVNRLSLITRLLDCAWRARDNARSDASDGRVWKVNDAASESVWVVASARKACVRACVCWLNWLKGTLKSVYSNLFDDVRTRLEGSRLGRLRQTAASLWRRHISTCTHTHTRVYYIHLYYS